MHYDFPLQISIMKQCTQDKSKITKIYLAYIGDSNIKIKR